MFRATALAIAALALAAPAGAGSSENIAACAEAAKRYADRELSEFDAAYEGSYIHLSEARWPGVVCEVKLGEVVNLTVDGEAVITDFFAGDAAKDLHAELEAETERALSVLENRKEILERRLDEAEARLQDPNPDLEAIRSFVAKGIARALGGSGS